MPVTVTRYVMKFMNAVLTSVLVLVLHATGQMPKRAPADEAGADNTQPVKQNTLSGLVKIVKAYGIGMPEYVPVPLYGINPLYGPAQYGIPFADFLVTGTIRSAQDSLPIQGIQVALNDTATDSSLVVSASDGDGTFSLSLRGWGWDLVSTWLLRAEDIDSAENGGEYQSRDTLVTIPHGSLKGGGTPEWNMGTAETVVALYLDEHAVSAQPRVRPPAAAPSLSVSRVSDNRAMLYFSIASAGRARMRVYNAAGGFITQLLDTDMQPGGHTMSVDISRLSGGAYFFRLDSNGFSRVTKALLAR
jgi:putative lipoprotein (rSAM/lipoprotein system)